MALLLTKDNRQAFLQQKTYILKFSATWCGPCKLLKPVFEKVSQSVALPCATVDIDNSDTKDLVQQYNVKSVPTIIKIDGNREIKRIGGFLAENALLKFIEEK